MQAALQPQASIPVYRSAINHILGTPNAVVAEDYPTQELCEKAAHVASVLLSWGLNLDKIENEIPILLGCNLDAPYGYALIIIERD